MRYWPFLLVLGIVFIGCAMMYESDDSDATATVQGSGTQAAPYTSWSGDCYDLWEFFSSWSQTQGLIPHRYFAYGARIDITIGSDAELVAEVSSVSGGGISEYGGEVHGNLSQSGYTSIGVYEYFEDDPDEYYEYWSCNFTVNDPPPSYTVSVYSAGGGTVTGGGTYTQGDLAFIAAYPDTGYHFTNWSDGNTNGTRVFTVTGDVSLTAYFAINTYTVSVYSAGGGTVTGGGTYTHGSTATITATPNTGYHFTNWSDGNTSASRTFTVTENVSLTAYFAINTYTVAWNNWDGTRLETDSNVAYGSTPSYDGATPTRPTTAQYTYIFTGWSPSISAVTGNTTYTAQFTALALCTIIWKNWDGTVLETDMNVVEGTLPTYDGTTPTRPETSEYRYSFDGWSPTVVPVTTDAEYTARFTTTSLFTVVWRNWNGTVLETDVSVPEGTTPTYNGSTPTRADTESFTYGFSGWIPAVGPISGYTEYTAQFTATALYLVTWLNWDGTVLDTEKIPEGTTPIYNGATPTRTMSVQYIYTFAGWSPTIVPITEDSEYTAQFSRTYREYTEGEWAYGILDSGYAILLDYTGSGGIVQIPVTIGGMAVSNIGVALKDNGSVTGVTIPSNIKSIVYDAFSGTSITEVLNLSELNITGTSYGLDGATIHTSIPGWFYISDVEYTDRVPDNSSLSKLIRTIPLLILIGVIVMIARNRVEDE